jgi:hypothetical protein
VCGRVGGRAAGPSPGRPSLGLVTVGPVWAGAPPPTVPACRLESPTAPTMHAGRGQGGRRACATAPVPATYITTLNVPVRHAWNRPSWTTRVTGVGLRVSTWLRRGAGEGGGCYGVGVCVWGDPDRADAGAGAARGVQVHNMACTTAPGGALGQGFVLVLCTPKVSVFLVLISVLNTIQSRQGVVRRQRQYIQYLWPKYDLYWSKKAGA